MNRKAYIAVKIAFGETDPFISADIVKQNTHSLDPILDYCSPNYICAEGRNFTFGSVKVKS